MEIGIRELRAHLSRYLDDVRGGNDLVVTDRGVPIARIVPMDGRRKIDRLIAAGLVSPTPKPRGDPPRPVKGPGTISDLVATQRQ
jgi:prevent-host-death family protein